jgi:hypothetical protein
MKLLWFAFLLFGHASAADNEAFMWQETRDERTQERGFGFFVACRAVKEAMEADARGDDAKAAELAAKVPAGARMYGVLLRGEATEYQKEKISMFSGHEVMEVSKGSIFLELRARVVKIALEILVDGKSVPFPGNGTFTYTEHPKR